MPTDSPGSTTPGETVTPVTKLAVVPQLKAAPNFEGIQILAEVIGRLQNGESLGFALVEMGANNSATYAVSGIGNRFMVIGVLSHLQYKLQADRP